MSERKPRWVLKAPDGQVSGPFSTEKVIHRINSGAISGEELIAVYPGGRWFPITQEPEFYDRLLDALSGQADDGPPDEDTMERTPIKSRSTPISKTARPEDETNGQTPPPVIPPPQKNKAERYSEIPPDEKPRKAKRIEPDEEQDDDEVIELVDMRVLIKSEIIKKAKLPAAIAGTVLLAVVLWLFLSGTPPEAEQRIHLLPLEKSKQILTRNSNQVQIDKALAEFLKDTYSGYIRAESDFVQLLQNDSHNTEVYALLCLTYNELWPFAYQDSADLKTIAAVSQAASQVDPGGQSSGACRVVDLIIRGRMGEAQSFATSILESASANQRPPIIFYYLKAILLEGTETQTAIGYLSSAQQLWPQWIRVYVYEAQLHAKANNPQEAARIYNEVLKANPAHTVSKLELGILEYKSFRDFDKAEDLLSSGVSSKGEHISRDLLSRSYFGLAEIALEKKDNSKALKYAQKAYAISTSNISAKNLIVQLGGVEKLKKTKVMGQHLIYEGDQFVREGDYQSAQAHFKAAWDEDHKNGLAAMKAAKCLWQLSLSTEAIEWLNRAIQADPNLLEAYILLADYYTQKFNFEAAARILSTAQRIAPKSHEVFRGFALVELRRNNPRAAVGFAKKAISLYEADGDSYIVLAKSYLATQSQDNYQLAYQAASKAVEIDINNREGQVVYAQALAGIQGVDVGIEYLKKLVSTYPLVIDYQIALGELLLSDERYGQAEEVFRRILKIDDKSKKTMLLLAKVLRNETKSEDALDTLLRAAVLDPADPEPLFQAALLYLENNRPDDAKAQFARVLRVNPAYPLVHYYMGRAALSSYYFGSGVHAFDKKQDTNLLEALNQAEIEKKLNPNMPEAYGLMAEAHMEMGEYSLCAADYQQVLKWKQQGAKIYVKIARCYRLAGNFDVASAMLNIAYTRESGYAEIFKERGLLYENQGDPQRAIEAYDHYFVLDPNAPDRAVIIQRLETLQRTHQ